MFSLTIILIACGMVDPCQAKQKRLAISINAAIVVPSIDMDFHIGNGFSLHAGVGLINPLITSKNPGDFVSSNFGIRVFGIHKRKDSLASLDGLFVGFKYLLGKLPDRGRYEGFAIEIGHRIMFDDNYSFTFAFSFGIVDPEIKELHDLSNYVYGDISVGFGVVF